MLEIFQLLAVSNAIIKSFKLLKSLPDNTTTPASDEKCTKRHYISPSLINESINSLKLWVILVLFRIYFITFEKYVSWIPGYFYVKTFLVMLTLFPQLKLVNFLYDELFMLLVSYVQYKIEEFAVTSSHDFVHKLMLLGLLVLFPHISDLEIVDSLQVQVPVTDLSVSDDDEEDEVTASILLQSNRKSILPPSLHTVTKSSKHVPPIPSTPSSSTSDEQNISPNRQHISLLDIPDMPESESIPMTPASSAHRSASVSRRISQSQRRLSQLSPYLQRLQTQFRFPTAATTTAAATANKVSSSSSFPPPPHSPGATATATATAEDGNDSVNTTKPEHTASQPLAASSSESSSLFAAIPSNDPHTSTTQHTTENMSEASMMDHSTIVLDRSTNSTYVSTTSPHFLRRLTRSAVGPNTSSSRRPSGAAALSRNLFGDFMRSMARNANATTNANANASGSAESQSSRGVNGSTMRTSPSAKVRFSSPSSSAKRSGSGQRGAVSPASPRTTSAGAYRASVAGAVSTSSIPPAKPPRVNSAQRTRVDTDVSVSLPGGNNISHPSPTVSRTINTEGSEQPPLPDPLVNSTRGSPSPSRASPASIALRKKWQ